jgi:hypothetical protein
MTAMTRWDAFDDLSTTPPLRTLQGSGSARAAGPVFQRPAAGATAPVWAPRVDITEGEEPRVVIELARRDSDQFGRSLTVAQRVIEDAIEAASEGGAPRAVRREW